MPMKVHEETCAVRDFVVVVQEPDGLPTPVFPDYTGAEHHAETLAKSRSGRRVFIAQITGELKSLTTVAEVHPK